MHNALSRKELMKFECLQTWMWRRGPARPDMGFVCIFMHSTIKKKAMIVMSKFYGI